MNWFNNKKKLILNRSNFCGHWAAGVTFTSKKENIIKQNLNMFFDRQF